MQIPPASSASQAAGILAQSASKDRSIATDAHAVAGLGAPHVEQTEGTDQDRDAQGQGDGFSGRREPRTNDDILDVEQENQSSPCAATLPGEPPSQLDIIG